MPATPTNWREAVLRLLPGWLTAEGGFGERVTGTVGLVTDLVSVAAGEAARAPWLLEETCPDDALPMLGEERRMPRYPGETAAAYKARLHAAWEAWEYAGTAQAIISQLEAFGLSDIEVMTPRDWDWDSAAPGTWEDGVGGDANWSRFWVVIKGHPWTGATWGAGGAWGSGGVIGLSATRDEIAAVRDIVQRWKGAEALNPWIIVVLDEVTWAAEQPDGTWHDWRNRSASARYIDGRGQRPVLIP
jgi:hypothetical protein